MSYRLLIFLLGTTLSAQLVPAPSRVPRLAELPASGAAVRWRLQAKPPTNATKPMRLFPAMRAPVTPVGNPRPAESLREGTIPKPQEPEVKNQTGPCSIPLTNVLRSSSATPEMPRLRIPDGTYTMRFAQVPAPPCTDK
jgi:hypothetical protein